MRLIFVHGWSVTHTNTYGDMPQSLSRTAVEYSLEIEVKHIHLGKYVSFNDEVTLDDIAIALDSALREISGNENEIEPFSCITHSTGGPVVRHWVEKYYGAKKLKKLPLKHLVMLAPANHGSSLAVLGKERVGRIKSWFSGVEPGQRVLDWLSLGSQGQWSLNQSFLKYRCAENNFFPFVLTGQGIDTKFYDFLNSYLVEPGSDGVIRVAGANMNCRFLKLAQSKDVVDATKRTLRLEYISKKSVDNKNRVPVGIFSQFSHSGKKMGIMAVESKRAPAHPIIVSEVLQCLQVNDVDGYLVRGKELSDMSSQEQSKTPVGKNECIDRYSMLVFKVTDQYGEEIPHEDFDILILAGKSYSPDRLPEGFYVDCQLNKKNNCLVYYVNADKMAQLEDGLFGLRVVVRPQEGFSYYCTGEFRSEGLPIKRVFTPNETTYIDIVINRQVDKNLFTFDSGSKPRKSFKRITPASHRAN